MGRNSMEREEQIKQAAKEIWCGESLNCTAAFTEGAKWADKHPVITEDTSDGYHSFKELYDFRLVYNAALFNELVHRGIKVTKSKRHSDGKRCFDSYDWFIVQAELPTGQISNHYEMKYWGYFNIPEVEKADEWDGHTPHDVLQRLTDFILKHQDL